MRAEFDFASFYAALDAARKADGLTWRQVAKRTDVSPSTLTRLSQGRKADVDTIAALSSWAELDLNQFTGNRHSRNYVREAASFIRQDPSLSAEEASALEQLLTATYARMTRDS